MNIATSAFEHMSAASNRALVAACDGHLNMHPKSFDDAQASCRRGPLVPPEFWTWAEEEAVRCEAEDALLEALAEPAPRFTAEKLRVDPLTEATLAAGKEFRS